MRNQITIASRSERIFASRWFERLIFIGRFAGEEDVGDFVAELGLGQVAQEDAVFADRDGAGFLADHQHHRVRLLAEADRRAMSHSKRRTQALSLCQWKDATRRHHPVTSQNNSAVM